MAAWQGLVAGTLAVLALAGCGGSQPTATVAASGVGACDVALAEGSAGGHARIVQLQSRARAAAMRTAHVEKLGWAFVAAARESGDAGYYGLALQAADCLDEQKAGSPEALLLRAHAQLQQHRFAEAEESARALVALRGSWTDHAVLGDALVERGGIAAAIGAYQRMADERPGPEAYARIAQVRWLRGDLDGAIEFMTRAARATSPGDRAGLAWHQGRLAQLVLLTGDFDTALRLARSARRAMPESANAFAIEGRVLLALDRPGEALPLLGRAASAGLAEHQWLWLEAAEAAGHPDEARRAAQALVATGHATDPRTYAIYLATRSDDPQAAVRIAQAELSVRTDVHTYDALAWALYKAGDLAGARSHSALAVALGTTDPRLWLHAGLIAASAGDAAAARNWLARAARLESVLLPSERAQLQAARAALDTPSPTTPTT
jgi:tetratricopeptide (TPR) repeat protein